LEPRPWIGRANFFLAPLRLRCASVTAPLGGCSLGPPSHRAFGAKTEPLVFFRHALGGAGLAARLELACRGAALTGPPVEFLPAPVQVSASEYKLRNILYVASQS
jgi:hypothetical protein